MGPIELEVSENSTAEKQQWDTMQGMKGHEGCTVRSYKCHGHKLIIFIIMTLSKAKILLVYSSIKQVFKVRNYESEAFMKIRVA